MDIGLPPKKRTAADTAKDIKTARRTAYRGTRSVPLLIRDGQASSSGTRRPAMAPNMDNFSTIVDLTEIDSKTMADNLPTDHNSLSSRSLVALLDDSSVTDWDDDIEFSEQEKHAFAVQKNGFNYSVLVKAIATQFLMNCLT